MADYVLCLLATTFLSLSLSSMAPGVALACGGVARARAPPDGLRERQGLPLGRRGVQEVHAEVRGAGPGAPARPRVAHEGARHPLPPRGREEEGCPRTVSHHGKSQ